jgi:hypothetical protein
MSEHDFRDYRIDRMGIFSDADFQLAVPGLEL